MKSIFKRFMLFYCAILFAFSMPYFNASAALNTNAAENPTVAIGSNIFINHVDVSGLTDDVALPLLKLQFEPTLGKTGISLNANGKTYILNVRSIKLHYDYDTALKQAHKLTKQAILPKTTSVNSSTPQAIETTSGQAVTTPSAVSTPSAVTPATPVNIKLSYAYDNALLNKFIKNLSALVDKNPVDPVLSIKGKNFFFTESKDGVRVNQPKLTAALKKVLLPGKVSAFQIPVIAVPSKCRKETLLPIKDKLGEFTTWFRLSDVNRVNNIKLASANANNFIILPGETFSINKEIGPRLESTGFKLAHVIMNNRFVDGIGGGICQVSTTLYNAVLFSDLKIIQRDHHSIPSTYVPVGRDATVSGDVKDLKFQNNTSSPIYVMNEIRKNSLTFSIYGKKTDRYKKVIVKTQILRYIPTKTITVKDPTLPRGQVLLDVTPHPGYKVRSYKEIYEKNRLVKTQELYTDNYPAITGIRKIGTKKPTIR